MPTHAVGDVVAVRSGNLYRIQAVPDDGNYRVIQIKDGEPWGPGRTMHASAMLKDRPLQPQPRRQRHDPLENLLDLHSPSEALLRAARRTLSEHPTADELQEASGLMSAAAQLLEAVESGAGK